MGPLTIAAIAATAALVALSQKKEGAGVGPTQAWNIPPDAKADLDRLAQSQKQAVAVVQSFFSIPPPPVVLPTVMVQYGLQLYAQGFQALGTFLANRAKEIMTPTTGASGTQWNTWSPGTRASDGMTTVIVLYESTPILSYSQKGNDKSTRVLVSEEKLPQGLPDGLMAKAHADFSV